VQALVAENPERVTLARSADEVRSASEMGQIAIILGFQNALGLERDISRIDALFADGVRLFGLTHLGHNDFADSSRPLFIAETNSYEPTEEHGGLSDLGRAAIERINALGGLVDVSQMSKAATLQAIALSERPVIASHSNVKQLSDVTRNLSDEEIDRIGATGGVIHVAPFSAYLVDLSDPDLLRSIREVRVAAGLPETYSYPYELYWELETDEEKLTFLGNMRALVGREDVARMVGHIDYVVHRIGVDHVGIGTDFNHGGGVVGFEEADSAQNVTAELVRRGYTSEEVEKIWGGNFLRVFDLSTR
jgi:membrane dipeptidase